MKAMPRVADALADRAQLLQPWSVVSSRLEIGYWGFPEAPRENLDDLAASPKPVHVIHTVRGFPSGKTHSGQHADTY